MQIEIPHSVVYDFTGRATVVEVAKSLIAQDKLFRDALCVLEACFPQLVFERSSLEVREVSQESPLKEVMIGVVVATYAPAFGEDMPDILKTLFGVDVPDSYDSIVSILILLIAIYGLDWLRKKLFPGQNNKELNLEKERLLVLAAERASVTESHMQEALLCSLAKRQRSIIRSSVDFLSPAKRLEARSIKVADGTNIGEGAIKATPSEVELAQYEPPIDTMTIENALVKFRRHDIDKNQGWAATIEMLSKQRVAMHLAPDINPKTLFERSSVRGDVIVTSTRVDDGEYVPNLYYLQRIYDDEP